MPNFGPHLLAFPFSLHLYFLLTCTEYDCGSLFCFIYPEHLHPAQSAGASFLLCSRSTILTLNFVPCWASHYCIPDVLTAHLSLGGGWVFWTGACTPRPVPLLLRCPRGDGRAAGVVGLGLTQPCSFTQEQELHLWTHEPHLFPDWLQSRRVGLSCFPPTNAASIYRWDGGNQRGRNTTESMKNVLEALELLCPTQLEGQNSAVLVTSPFNGQPLQLYYWMPS